MSHLPTLYLIAYDISDDKRLRQVYKTMRGFGDHLQFSVFRCVLSDAQLARLEGRLQAIIHHREDQVLVVPLGRAESQRAWRMHTLGKALVHPERVVKIL